MFDEVKHQRVDLSSVNLRLCVDGARRGDGLSAAGFALIGCSRDRQETILFRGGRQLGRLHSAFVAELMALEVALLYFAATFGT